MADGDAFYPHEEDGACDEQALPRDLAQELADLQTERDELRAEIERLTALARRPYRVNLEGVVNAFIKRDVDKPARPTQSIWVTTLAESGECLRRAVLATTHRMYAAPRTIDGSRIRMAAGLQERLVKHVAMMMDVPLTSDQQYVSDHDPSLPLSGKIDFRFPEPDCRILEIKSANAQVFASIKRTGLDESDFYWVRHYTPQCHAQLLLANEQELALAFWCRDSLEAMQFEIHRDSQWDQWVMDQTSTIRSHCLEVMLAIQETGNALHEQVIETLPPLPTPEDAPPCDRCPYRTVCNPVVMYRVTDGIVKNHPRLEQAMADLMRTKAASNDHKKASDFARQQVLEYADANMPGESKCRVVVGAVTALVSRSASGRVTVKYEGLPGGDDGEEPNTSN